MPGDEHAGEYCICGIFGALAQEFQRAAIDWIARFEARYSRFLPESIVGQINAQSGGDWLELDEDADRLLSLCAEMHRLTRGVFDRGGAAAAADLGLEGGPAARSRRIRDSRRAVNFPAGTRCSAARAAFACRSRGWESTSAASARNSPSISSCRMARSFGISDVMIDIGQDIRVAGHPPGKDAWYIGLEEPDRPGECWTGVRLTDQAVATSGDYFRSFTLDGRRYGHILDPRTGLPVSNGCQAVSVIAPNCVMAGILSTAAFILGARGRSRADPRAAAASKLASPPNTPGIKRGGFHPMSPHNRSISRAVALAALLTMMLPASVSRLKARRRAARSGVVPTGGQTARRA